MWKIKEIALFLEKSAEKFCRFKKKILGYGVMVTLQILVLSFLVRVRVSQQSKSSILSLGYGVMVTLQILVLSFLVRVRVSQLIR